MKTTKIIYWITTGLLSAMLLMSAGMYVFDHETVSGMFEMFGFPTYIIYPLALAKVIAVIVLWAPKMPKLKEWAYSALFFELILAFFAHFMIDDNPTGAAMAIVLLVTSYFTYQKLNSSKKD